MYVVLAYRRDCGDVDVFTVEDSFGRTFWATFDEARAVMKADYRVMLGEYPREWMRAVSTGKRRHRIGKTNAEFSVPIWDAVRRRESSLKCKWKVVRI